MAGAGSIPSVGVCDPAQTTTHSTGPEIGTAANLPYDGQLGSHIIGCDAFATLQSAVKATTPGRTLHMAAGNYPELVIVESPMTILGPDAGIDPRGAPCGGGVCGPEAIIDGMGMETAIAFASSGITLDGFTI